MKNIQNEQLSDIPKDWKSLPTVGISTVPNQWKYQKAIRDTELTQQNQPKYWIFEGKLYDLQQFINIHPGGKSWLKNTKGHDITELFIIHHLNQAKARQQLNKYFVRNCKRTIQRFTFQKDGLYRTVKKQLLKQFSKQQIQDESKSKIQAYIICFLFFTSITISAISNSYLFAIISGILLMGIFGVMHNFIHHKQNKFSHLIKFCGYSFDDFQIMHCISHHIYPNTELDFQITGLQPIAYWLRSKPKNRFYNYLLIQLILAIASPLSIITNLIIFPLKKLQKPNLDYAYPIFLLFYMYLLNRDLFITIKIWLLMYSFYSFFFFKILLCEHRMPELWTEGNKRIFDFGQHTVSTTSDVNPNITGILSYVFLAGFNLHVIHHFFPTADHSILPKINQILIKICKQKGIKHHSMGRIQCSIKFIKGMFNRTKFEESNLIKKQNKKSVNQKKI